MYPVSLISVGAIALLEAYAQLRKSSIRCEGRVEGLIAQDKHGSKQKDIWGADWLPFTQEIAYESIINIRPSQNNRSMIIQDLAIRERVKQITVELISGHEPEFK